MTSPNDDRRKLPTTHSYVSHKETVLPAYGATPPVPVPDYKTLARDALRALDEAVDELSECMAELEGKSYIKAYVAIGYEQAIRQGKELLNKPESIELLKGDD